jgi:predicted kinase
MPAHEHLERLELLEMWLDELGMLSCAPVFASRESRLRSLTGSWQPHVASPDPAGPRLVILSGLPASGKSTHAASLDCEIISLDELRRELPGHARQLTGRVRQEAALRIRRALAAGSSCCLDATGLTRQARSPWLRLGREYGALLEIHCIEAPASELLARNAQRAARRRCPCRPLGTWHRAGRCPLWTKRTRCWS